MNSLKTEAQGLIQRRFEALAAGDFAALYASYHPQAPFIRQFPSEREYLDFAAAVLARMRILTSHIGASRETDEGTEVICGLHFELDGEQQVLFELALLIDGSQGWRYHSAQKLTAEEYGGGFAGLGFEHFDSQAAKIRF